MPAYHSVSHNTAIDVMGNAEIMIGKYSIIKLLGFKISVTVLQLIAYCI